MWTRSRWTIVGRNGQHARLANFGDRQCLLESGAERGWAKAPSGRHSRSDCGQENLLSRRQPLAPWPKRRGWTVLPPAPDTTPRPGWARSSPVSIPSGESEMTCALPRTDRTECSAPDGMMDPILLVSTHCGLDQRSSITQVARCLSQDSRTRSSSSSYSLSMPERPQESRAQCCLNSKRGSRGLSQADVFMSQHLQSVNY
jgi:hypothetical protein